MLSIGHRNTEECARGAARRIVIDVRGGEAGNLVRTVPVHVVTVNAALPGAAIVGLDEAATESSG